MKERFWKHVNIKSDNECWEWKGNINRSGYGQFTIRHKNYRSHRIAYDLTYDTIPDGKQVLHHCDNRKCCNPNHLFLGTNQDNMMDAKIKGKFLGRDGKNNSNSKFMDFEIMEIRNLYMSGLYSYRNLSNIYKTSHSNICNIINKKSWKNI